MSMGQSLPQMVDGTRPNRARPSIHRAHIAAFSSGYRGRASHAVNASRAATTAFIAAGNPP